MKFDTLVDLYKKLLNTKFEANLTFMSRVMAITSFDLEAKIGLAQKAVTFLILNGFSIFQLILIRNSNI